MSSLIGNLAGHQAFIKTSVDSVLSSLSVADFHHHSDALGPVEMGIATQDFWGAADRGYRYPQHCDRDSLPAGHAVVTMSIQHGTSLQRLAQMAFCRRGFRITRSVVG
jgi:hypothetical protein